MVQGLKEFRNESNGREPLDIQCCAGTLALLMGLVCSLLEFVAVLLLLLAKLVPGSSTAQLPTHSQRFAGILRCYFECWRGYLTVMKDNAAIAIGCCLCFCGAFSNICIAQQTNPAASSTLLNPSLPLL